MSQYTLCVPIIRHFHFFFSFISMSFPMQIAKPLDFNHIFKMLMSKRQQHWFILFYLATWTAIGATLSIFFTKFTQVEFNIKMTIMPFQLELFIWILDTISKMRLSVSIVNTKRLRMRKKKEKIYWTTSSLFWLNGSTNDTVSHVTIIFRCMKDLRNICNWCGIFDCSLHALPLCELLIFILNVGVINVLKWMQSKKIIAFFPGMFRTGAFQLVFDSENVYSFHIAFHLRVLRLLFSSFQMHCKTSDYMGFSIISIGFRKREKKTERD